ncbi:MAG: HPt (histidine-containing phosphotransfer) domain-containing protein [Gammaproteobacteria bacterium]|jgi:HPt (histidine-containing phosphotransfer) domain-containing protein
MAERDPPPSTDVSISSSGVEDISIDDTLLERLREDIPLRQTNIAAALAKKPPDIDIIAGEAHRIAGAAAYCGQPALHEAATALERAVQTNDSAKVQDTWTRLLGLLEQLLR